MGDDTYEIPRMIMTAGHRQALYGGKMFTFGDRQKFGNDSEKHVDFSAVTHVAKENEYRVVEHYEEAFLGIIEIACNLVHPEPICPLGHSGYLHPSRGRVD